MIKKCYYCKYIDITGKDKCVLCGNKVMFTHASINFDNLDDGVKSLIVKLNRESYDNFYLSKQQNMEYHPVVNKDLIVVDTGKKYKLFDKTTIFGKYAKDENYDVSEFNSLIMLKSRIFNKIILDDHKQINEFLNKKNELIKNKNKKNFLGKYINCIKIQQIGSSNFLYIEPKLIGIVELCKMNNYVTEERYLEIFKMVNSINQIYSQNLFASESLIEGTQKLFDYVKSLDGKDVNF